MPSDELAYRPSWAEQVFLFACEHNLDPPHRCPGCAAGLRWGLRELRALVADGVRCERCGFDLAGDRGLRPLRYAMDADGIG